MRENTDKGFNKLRKTIQQQNEKFNKEKENIQNLKFWSRWTNMQ